MFNESLIYIYCDKCNNDIKEWAITLRFKMKTFKIISY